MIARPKTRIRHRAIRPDRRAPRQTSVPEVPTVAQDDKPAAPPQAAAVEDDDKAIRRMLEAAYT